VLVDRELGRPFTRLDLDGHDLLVEPARSDRRGGTAVRLERELVLRFARDPVGPRQILGCHSHVDLVERVRQRAEDRVDKRRVAHSGAPPDVLHPIGASAHRLRAARERYLRLAGLDDLGRRHDRLQAASTQTVERQRRRLLRNPGVDPDDPRQIMVLGRSVDDVAEHHLLHLPGVESRALDGCPGRGGAEVGRRDVTQAPPERSDRGPGR
jgi:hypothetical protein